MEPSASLSDVTTDEASLSLPVPAPFDGERPPPARLVAPIRAALRIDALGADAAPPLPRPSSSEVCGLADSVEEERCDAVDLDATLAFLFCRESETDRAAQPRCLRPQGGARRMRLQAHRVRMQRHHFVVHAAAIKPTAPAGASGRADRGALQGDTFSISAVFLSIKVPYFSNRTAQKRESNSPHRVPGGGGGGRVVRVGRRLLDFAWDNRRARDVDHRPAAARRGSACGDTCLAAAAVVVVAAVAVEAAVAWKPPARALELAQPRLGKRLHRRRAPGTSAQPAHVRHRGGEASAGGSLRASRSRARRRSSEASELVAKAEPPPARGAGGGARGGGFVDRGSERRRRLRGGAAEEEEEEEEQQQQQQQRGVTCRPAGSAAGPRSG
eukprot:SAG31_NODE_1355_length_8661_cov_3.130343_6_plen_385_part_00